MNKILGNIYKAFSVFLDGFYTSLIYIVEFIVQSADIIKNILLPLVVMSIIGVFIFPPLLIFLLTGIGLVLILFVVIIFSLSILGRNFLNYLNRLLYVQPNYFKDLYLYYKGDIDRKPIYNEYTEKYFRMQREKFEEELRREEERRRQRQKAQEEQWKRIFEEAFGNYNTSYSGNYQQNTGNYNTNYSPFSSFKKQYEEACDILGVDYNADYQTIKSNYRKLAKKYHPDLSKEKNADEMFKKINNAFDFLSENNVQRYKNL